MESVPVEQVSPFFWGGGVCINKDPNLTRPDSLFSCRPRVLEMDKEENRRPSNSSHHRRHSISSSENYWRRGDDDDDSDKHRESSGRNVKMRRH